ncbi:MAG: NHL repeat-containing protein [Candidatus Omnitrophica bacterium]|nr:NHL repeat-containing protein [Candidatus Omnitrophota bacterium]
MNKSLGGVKKGSVELVRSYQEGLEGPSSIREDPKSHVVVVEEFGHRVRKFDNNFNCLFSIGKKGNGVGEFIYPSGIAIDTAGNLYITDRWNHRVQKYSEEGVFLLQFGSYGSKEGQLSEPWGIAVLPTGNILVVDHGNARLVVFDCQGAFITQFGTCGASQDFYEGERFKRNFHFQNWLRNVYTLNTVESRFYKYKFDVGELEYPEKVSINSNGDIYVTDRVSGHVAVFTPLEKTTDDVDSRNVKKTDNSLMADTVRRNNSLTGFTATFSLKKILDTKEGTHCLHEPSSVYAGDDGFFIAEESSGLLYWNRSDETLVFDLGIYNIKISDIYFVKEKNRLYVCDAWNNTISVFALLKK